MRVTAGKYKNRRLVCPPGIIRPAMEKMRVSLFSILGDLNEMTMLDVFSGSGIMSAEACSRGVVSVDMVEKDFLKKKYIISNLSFVEENKNVFIMDVLVFLKRFKNKKKYDLIYLDPPFNFKGKVELLNMAYTNGFLKDNSIIVMHYPKEDDSNFSNLCSQLEVYDVRHYGRSTLKFIKLSK